MHGSPPSSHLSSSGSSSPPPLPPCPPSLVCAGGFGRQSTYSRPLKQGVPGPWVNRAWALLQPQILGPPPAFPDTPLDSAHRHAPGQGSPAGLHAHPECPRPHSRACQACTPGLWLSQARLLGFLSSPSTCLSTSCALHAPGLPAVSPAPVSHSLWGTGPPPPHSQMPRGSLIPGPSKMANCPLTAPGLM